MSFEPTREQKTAIETRGSSMLVQAGAGSGKTAVLTQRIAALVCEGAGIQSMLVVTFTNAAAAEMKGRVQQLLADKANDAGLSPAARTNAKRGLSDFHLASISTLHAFCASLLRRHFQAAGLDPAFVILDDFEARAMREQAAADTLEAAYEKGEPAFLELDEGFAAGRKGLAPLLLDTLAAMEGAPEPERWLHEAAAKYDTARFPVEQSAEYAYLIQDAAKKLQRAKEKYAALAKKLEGLEAYAKLSALLDTEGAAFDELRAFLASGEVSALAGFKFFRMPVIKGSEEYKRERDEAKKLVQSIDVARLDTAAQTALIGCMLPQLEALEGLMTEFMQRYKAKKQSRGGVDYSDLEHLALTALDEPAIAKEYREKFSHIFIDEYQDTNSVQEAIIDKLRRDDNVFRVGDIKQSIYGFRGAEPRLFAQKQRECEEGRGVLVPLNSNFRSLPNVLDCVNDVFEYLLPSVSSLSYGQNDRLVCGASGESRGGATELYIIDKQAQASANIENQARFAAKTIRGLLGKQLSGGKLCAPGDIAVLLRTTRGSAEAFSRVFAEEGLASYADLSSGYFESVEIQTLLALLRVVDNSRQDVPLLAALRFGVCGFTDSDIAGVRAAFPEGGFSAALRQAARSEAKELEALGGKCRDFLDFITAAKRRARCMRLSLFVQWLLDAVFFRERYALMPSGEQRLANIDDFFLRLEAYEARSAGGLNGFLRYIDDALASGLDYGQSRTLGGDGSCVRIMSVHKSKGLEFPVVLLCDICRQFNKADSRSKVIFSREGIGMSYYDGEKREKAGTLYSAAYAARALSELRAEEARLLYVAMTRAREKLVLIGCGKPVPDSHAGFILTALGKGEQLIPAEYPQSSRPDKAKGDWRLCSVKSDIIAGGGQSSAAAGSMTAPPPELGRAVGEALVSYAWQPGPGKVSVSQLGRMAHQARSGKKGTGAWRPELPTPLFMQQTRMTPADRGTALHAVMQGIDLSKGLDEAGVRVQIAELEENGYITRAQAECVDAGAVAGFFETEPGRLLKTAELARRELPFSLLIAPEEAGAKGCEKVTLQGVIDLCILTQGGWVIVDYKTDTVTGLPEEAARAHREQLEWYAKALERSTQYSVAAKYIYLTKERIAVKL